MANKTITMREVRELHKNQKLTNYNNENSKSA